MAKGCNLCPQIGLLLVFFSSGGMILLETSWVSSFISSFIHSTQIYGAPTTYQTLLHKASPEVKWKPRQSHHGNMPSHVKSARAQPPDPKETRDECVYWEYVYWVSSHRPSNHQRPFTFYQVRQLLCTQCPQSALFCLVCKDSLISVGHSHPLFIFSTHVPNEALCPRSSLVRNVIPWGLGTALFPGTS